MASELKPCPFCRATAKLNKYYGGTAFTVVCDNLHRINTFETEAEAVATWNTRPAPAATDTGLVTVGYAHRGTIGLLLEGAVSKAVIVPKAGGDFNTPVMLVEQAVELLAAERAWAKDRGVLAVKLALENSGLQGQIDTLKADNAAKDARIKELEDYAREATKAITGLTGGGSENFSKEIGDVFTADLPFCLDRIRERYVSKVELKRLEAKLTAAEKALTEIASFTQTTDLLWWQERARAVLGGKP